MEPDSISLDLAEAFRREDPEGKRAGRVFRETFDQAYHGQYTGRYRLDQLSKTEKAHIGSLVEINLRREFDGFISDGEWMDFKIAGYEVDCKYSMKSGGWMIPPEASGHHAMLCHADDTKSTWEIGFIHCVDEVLNTGKNRDLKRSVSMQGKSAIAWAFRDAPMPPNTLQQLTPLQVEEILAPGSGTQRLDNLFRTASGMLIPRGIIATVAQQKDYMKRVRGNGGSRTSLREEGYVILGQYKNHQEIAQALGLPVPEKGENVSIRLYPAESDCTDPVVSIDGVKWRKARPEDPVVKAPIVDKNTRMDRT